MAVPYTTWSKTPSDNTATPPNGAPAGMLPSQSESVWRNNMSGIATLGDAVSSSAYIWAGTTAGTTTAYTATIGPVLAAFALADGLTVRMKINATNTGDSTFNLTATGAGALGAKKIYKQSVNGPVVLAYGDLQINGIAELTYDSSLNAAAGGWQLIGSVSSATTPVLLTGGAAASNKIEISTAGLITSNYRTYEIRLWNMAAGVISIVLSTDNGSTYLSANYAWAGLRVEGGSVTASDQAGTASIQDLGSNGVANGRATITISNPGNGSAITMLDIVINSVSTTPKLQLQHYSAYNTTTTAINGIKISSGTFTAGYELWGYP